MRVGVQVLGLRVGRRLGDSARLEMAIESALVTSAEVYWNRSTTPRPVLKMQPGQPRRKPYLHEYDVR